MPRLLITGFDNFGENTINPSWEAVRLLPEICHGYQLRRLQLPTIFGKAAQAVPAAAEEFCPDVILCVGLAVGRDAVTPERIAVNIRDARIPDNEGYQPEGEPVAPDGPAAIFATVPVKEMAAAIRAEGIPAAVSNTAGTFVCNDTLYALLHYYAGSDTRVGFIHIPALPCPGKPGLPLEASVRALEAAISAL